MATASVLPPEVTQSVPITGIYKEKQALAQRAYEQALADLTASRGKTLSNYGFKGLFDQAGKLSSYELDPAQELGAVQRLNRQYGQVRESARDESLSRGLGVQSGLGRRGIEDAHFDWTAAYSDTTKGFLGDFDQLARAGVDAKQSLSQAMIAAEQEAIQAAIQERMYTDQKKADERNFAEQQRQFSEQMKQSAAQFSQSMAMQQAQMNAAGGGMDPMQMLAEMMAGGGGDVGAGGGGVLGYDAGTVEQMMALVRSVPTAKKRDALAAQDPGFAEALHVFRYINGGGT